MLVYQWSATPREDCWDEARRRIRLFARFARRSLEWPAARVLVSSPTHRQPSLLLEFLFADGPDFEAAWKRLNHHEDTDTVWRALRPLLDESSIQRAVYEIQYARAGTIEG